MRLATYEAMHGEEIEVDLDSVTDVADGRSGLRPGWKSLVVYDPTTDAFIELGSNIPEPHDLILELQHKPAAYWVEVDEDYLRANYGLNAEQIRAVREKPAEWLLIHVS